ncbi:ribosome assembly RNA-binding protein YhbY [Cardiobacterium hominis]|uniref:ribosome assembly RNA-binding protein YhbY n=1 Tax=Cardiobacterium hominis TaxID=2718 RepID=UPI0028D6945C|nr:ribosome assembly RNA-binding protein YhbY [Cardiobacterium hominis]
MLSKNQIRFLKAQAHHLHPVVLIGANGISEGVDREVDRALDSHELIKVKLGNIADDIQAEMIDHIVQTHHAEFVQKIGHIAVFYRRNAEQAKIVLPKD